MVKHSPTFYKHDTRLSSELSDLQQIVEAKAKEYGLDFFDTIFEVLDWNQINEVAAFGGFPNRYPHWRFGMEYERLSKSYAYGLSKIYEMVINNDPCYAYLLHSNAMVDQKMVMAHVYGHCDFFKNNVYFAHTNRKMMDEMANHRTKITRYIERYGYDRVEAFIDACLSLDSLIDCHSPTIKRQPAPASVDGSEVHKFKSEKQYMDKYINPTEFIEFQREQLAKEAESEQAMPLNPEKDVMLFLLENAPLERWERDVLSIIREEAYYFAPQGQTKILNEGWACMTHTRMMTEYLLTDSEVIDYADRHSSTVMMQPGQINPYKIGLELLRDIKDRWDKGKFGKEYAECSDMKEKKNWDKQLGLGWEKIFEVRKLYNDITFIDTFLTPEFCQEHKLFTFSYNVSADQYEIASREFEKVKQKLLFQLTNFGKPIINVVDGNFKNRGDVLLSHTHDGVDLRVDYAQETLKNLYLVWRRPVHIETTYDGAKKLISFDGSSHTESRV